MSLIYGYSYEGNDEGNTSDISNLENLVGSKSDGRYIDSAFGRIKKNRKDIQISNSFVGSLSSLEGESNIKGTQLSHASAIAAHSNNLLNVEDAVGKKTDPKTKDSAFGRIKRNKEDIQISNNLLGSSNSLEGESNIKGTQLSHASAIMAHSNNLLNLEDAVGKKTDDKTKDTAFGRIRRNEESIGVSNNLVGSSSSLEGESNIKGTQLSHASAIAAHAGNLLNVEDAVGAKTDSKSVDSAFGRIQKNKENLEKLKHSVELRETTGTFVAPTDDGKVEITGWTMPRSSTIIAIIIKAKQNLTGVHWATLHSGTSMSNNSYMIVSLMTLANMKLGSPAILLNTRDPGHARMYASTRGNAKGSVGDRMIEVKFIYIDHTTPILK